MNRSSLFHETDQRLKQKGLLHKRDSIKKQVHGKEGKSGKKGVTKKRKSIISLAINEALDDLKNIHDYGDMKTELVTPSPIKETMVTELEAVSPIKEKQRRSSFDITHSKSPIFFPIVPEEVIEPLSLSPSEISESIHPTEEELLDETDMVIYLLTSRNGACKIPTKSVLTSKQEFEFQNIIHSIISARRSLYKENDNEDIVHYYFDSSEISRLVDILRYESPYGTSPTGYLLEMLCKFDLDYTNQITKLIAQFVWQFVLDERELPAQADEDYKTIQKQIGSIHRYVNFFQFLVESLRLNVALSPPTCAEQMEAYLQQSAALLRIVKCLVCTRNTVEKYTELLSSMTICLFSIAPQEIQAFYQFVLRHWPRGYSEKTIGLVQFLENLLSSSPPLYLTPSLKDVVHKIFKKVCQELLGSQVEISKRCAYFLQNYYLRSNYIAVDQGIVMTVKNALDKGMEHRNEIIANICEKAIDLILDDI